MKQSRPGINQQDNEMNPEPCKSREFTKARVIKNLVLLSFAFLASFTASEGLAPLQSTMNKEVGVISFVVQYACGCIASLFLPKYLIKKFGSKFVIVASLFAYVPYLSSNYYPVFGFMVPTSIIVGFASSLVFNSVCTYVNNLACLYTKLSLENECPNLHTDSSSMEKESLKHNLTSDSQFYVGYRKCSNSVFIPKPILFVDDFSICAVPIDKDNAVFEFEHGSPLRETISEINNDKSKLKVRDLKKERRKSDVLIGKIQNVLGETRDSLKFRHRLSLDSSDNILKTFSAHRNKLKLAENGITSDASGKNLECGIKPKNFFEEEQMNFHATDICNSEKAVKALETTTSRFFGFFGCVFNASNILCNVISQSIFKTYSVEKEYNSNSSCVCGSEFCSMESACILHNLEMPNIETRFILTTVYVLISFLSAVTVLLLLDNLNKRRCDVSFSWEMAIMTFKFHRNKNQLLLIPLSLYIGIGQAFFLVDFTKDFIGCAWGVEHVSLVLFYFGCALSLSCGLYGLVEKHVGRSVFFSITATVNFAVNVTLLYWIPVSSEPTMMFVIASVFGAFGGIMWSQLKTFIALSFKEEEETAFGCYQLWHALGMAIAFGYSNYLCTYIKIYIMLILFLIAVIGYLLAERNYYLSKKQCKM